MSRKLPWKINQKTGTIDYLRTTGTFEHAARMCDSGNPHKRKKYQKFARDQVSRWSRGGAVIGVSHNGKTIKVSNDEAMDIADAWNSIC